MGAVCYKPKPTTISKQQVLQALNDKYLSEKITQPEWMQNKSQQKNQTEENNQSGITANTTQLNIQINVKQQQLQQQQQLKQLSQYNNLLIFGKLAQQQQHLQNDQEEDEQTVKENSSKIIQRKQKNILSNKQSSDQFELKILSYFGHKEDIYRVLTQMSKISLYFMKKNYKNIENQPQIRHQNEKIRFIQAKSIEEHQSGVNQLLKLNNKELVSASDDCFLKFWNATNMKTEASLPTETITCIALTGNYIGGGGNNNNKTKEILVAGCHSGNLLMISTIQKVKKEQVTSAHYNLIRVIVSLEALKNKYFATADVCGIVKVWTSQFKPQQIIEIQQDGAISYNSMIEVQDVLPKTSSYEEAALIACALKSQKINLILLMPSSGNYQIIKTLRTLQKPTCLIQLSNKHLAIAVGSLKEHSNIEIHDLNKNKITSKLCYHKDMIDSMLKVDFPVDKLKNNLSSINNQYVTWFLTASRDRQIVLWKLIDGKIMRRNQANFLASNKKQSATPSNNGVRTFSEIRKNRKKNQKQKNQQRSGNNNINNISEDDSDDDQQQQLMDENNSVDDEEDDDDDSDKNRQSEEEKVDEQNTSKGNTSQIHQDKQIDFYYAFDTGHKDFIRSMVQLNNGTTLITASEDKTIKVFTIGF